MPSLYTEIEIDAPRNRVWQILLQKQNWKYWNTFLYDCDPRQPLEPGRQVLLALRRVPGEPDTEFQPRITLVQPGVCLAWVSSFPGFRNEYVFELQDSGFDRTRYVHRERFSGPLTRLFFPFIRQDEAQGIRRMAYELKDYAEHRGRSSPWAGERLRP